MDFPLLPGSTIGILGGGQLGRMLTACAHRSGYRTISWIGHPDSGPAAQADQVIEEPFDDPDALQRFLEEADVATVEFENIPLSLLQQIEQALPLFPNARAIEISQHREREKSFLRESGIPCADFWVIDSLEALEDALQELPERGGILKTAEFGYDGKGQLRVAGDENATDLWEQFAGQRAVLEEFVGLETEVSVLVARAQDGTIEVYDPAENLHRNHILDVSIVPARIDESYLEQSRDIAVKVAESLDYVGILAVEFFITQRGRVLVNEMAPRPHNSGHHTIEACASSQFEQQLRAITGLPLGSPRLLSPAVMMNLLGDVWPETGQPAWPELLSTPGTTLHLYGKQEARVGRKMGHATTLLAAADEADSVIALQRSTLGIEV